MIENQNQTRRRDERRKSREAQCVACGGLMDSYQLTSATWKYTCRGGCGLFYNLKIHEDVVEEPQPMTRGDVHDSGGFSDLEDRGGSR